MKNWLYPICGKLIIGYLSQSQTCVRLRLAEKVDFGVFTSFYFIVRVLYSHSAVDKSSLSGLHYSVNAVTEAT